MSRIWFLYRLYSLSLLVSFFAIILYYWSMYQLTGCFSCMEQVWEPNPIIHSYEWVMMLTAIPGIGSLVWRLSQ